MPPPIRYPLPTLLAFALLGILVWRGGDWIRGMRDSFAAGWTRAVEGPPAPESNSPQVVAGPMIRRALLLRDGTPVSSRPGSEPDGSIGQRMFIDIYATWPASGQPERYRVGNRGPIGWVAAGDCLEWNTRLVVRSPAGRFSLAGRPGEMTRSVEVGLVPLPVIGWEGDWFEVAVWDRKRPWSVIERRGWLKSAEVTPAGLGVLLAREELPRLINQTLAAEDDASRNLVRLRAILGGLIDPVGWSPAEVETARRALPSEVFAQRAGASASERIAAVNEAAGIDATWGGHSFRFLGLSDLP